MRPNRTLKPRGCQRLFLSVAAVLAALSPPGSARAEPPEARSRASLDAPLDVSHGSYYGAFIGFELRAGVSSLGIDPTRQRNPPSRFSPLGQLSLRFANLFSLIDLDLGVGLAGSQEEVPDGRHEVLHTRIMGEARLHPFFMSNLEANWLRSGIYFALGLGLDLLSTRGLDGSPSAPRTDAGFAISWGLGVDFPLSDLRTADPSVWLGLGYRMRFVGFSKAPEGLRDRDSHDLFVALSVRWHDIGFARFPRPPELDDRDRPFR